MRATFVLLVLSLTAPSVEAQQRITPPDSLDAFIERQMRERRIPGLALAIARNGTVLTARGYGVAEVQNGAAVTADTRFDLASVTKPFTAAGIMLLVEDGKVDLDASIATYLPDIPAAWRPITTRHLLTHTSGLPPLDAGFSGYGIVPVNISTLDAYNAARADTLYFPPGQRYMYSDVGYFLLGMITEKAGGITWREFIRQRILEPLALTETYIQDQDRIHRNEARTYTIRDGELRNARRVRQHETPAHHGMFSNVYDLVKWDAALYTDRLLTEKSRTQLWTPGRLSDGSTYPYGFGWQTWSQRGHTIHRHTGRTGTEIVRLPTDTLVVIVLTNLGGTGPGINSWGIALLIADMLVPGLQRPPLVAAAITENELEQFVGLYVAGDGRRARIIVDGGRLRLAPAAAPVTVELVYQGNLTFEVATADRQLVFDRGSGGNITGFTMLTAGGAPPVRFVRAER